MLSNDFGMLSILMLFGWFISMAFAAHLGGQRNAGMAGLILGFLFGPIGMVAAGLLDRRPHCERCGGRQGIKPSGLRYEICEHCGTQNREATDYVALGQHAELAASRQRKFAVSALAATLLALVLFFTVVPTRIGPYPLPAVGLLCIVAAIWLGLFKLTEAAWEYFFKNDYDRPVATG